MHVRTSRHLVLSILAIAHGLSATILADLSPLPTAQADAVRSMDRALNADDADAFVQLYDIEALQTGVLDPLDVPVDLKAELAQDIDSGIEKLALNIVNMMERGGSATVIRVQTHESRITALVRINIYAGGYVYLEFHFAERPSGDYRIVDHFDYSDSMFVSERIKTLLVVLVPEEGLMQKVLRRMLGISSLGEDAKRLARMTRLLQANRFDEAFEIYHDLPPELQANRALAIPVLGAAHRSGHSTFYAEALANIERHFSEDDELAYMMIDHYFLKGDFERAEQKVDQAIDALGIRDAGLLLIKASIAMQQGEHARAEDLLNEAIEADPFFQAAYYTAMDVAVLQGNYDKVVALMDRLHQCCEVTFSPDSLRMAPHYAAFLRSEAGREWISKQSGD